MSRNGEAGAEETPAPHDRHRAGVAAGAREFCPAQQKT